MKKRIDTGQYRDVNKVDIRKIKKKLKINEFNTLCLSSTVFNNQ